MPKTKQKIKKTLVGILVGEDGTFIIDRDSYDKHIEALKQLDVSGRLQGDYRGGNGSRTFGIDYKGNKSKNPIYLPSKIPRATIKKGSKRIGIEIHAAFVPSRDQGSISIYSTENNKKRTELVLIDKFGNLFQQQQRNRYR